MDPVGRGGWRRVEYRTEVMEGSREVEMSSEEGKERKGCGQRVVSVQTTRYTRATLYTIDSAFRYSLNRKELNFCHRSHHAPQTPSQSGSLRKRSGGLQCTVRKTTQMHRSKREDPPSASITKFSPLNQLDRETVRSRFRPRSKRSPAPLAPSLFSLRQFTTMLLPTLLALLFLSLHAVCTPLIAPSSLQNQAHKQPPTTHQVAVPAPQEVVASASSPSPSSSRSTTRSSSSSRRSVSTSVPFYSAPNTFTPTATGDTAVPGR